MPFIFQAKADTVDALEKYRGRCEPCFLFFAVSVGLGVSTRNFESWGVSKMRMSS